MAASDAYPETDKNAVYSDASRCFFFCSSSMSRRVHSAHLKMCRSLRAASVTSPGFRSSSLRRPDRDLPCAPGWGNERERAPAVSQTEACRSRRRGVMNDSSATASFPTAHSTATIKFHDFHPPFSDGFCRAPFCIEDEWPPPWFPELRRLHSIEIGYI